MVVHVVPGAADESQYVPPEQPDAAEISPPPKTLVGLEPVGPAPSSRAQAIEAPASQVATRQARSFASGGASRLGSGGRTLVDRQGSFTRNSAGLRREDGAIAALIAEIAEGIGQTLGSGSLEAFELYPASRQGLVGAVVEQGMTLASVNPTQDAQKILERLRS